MLDCETNDKHDRLIAEFKQAHRNQYLYFLKFHCYRRVFTRMAFFGEKVAEIAKIGGSLTFFWGTLSQKETNDPLLNTLRHTI